MAASWRRRLGRLRRRLLGTAVPVVKRQAAEKSTADPVPTREEIGERRLATFRRILGMLPPGRLLDLGAGHGAFSLIARELGWDVTAVDARTERMPMADGIRWIQHDVRTFDVSGYDCIAILGLLYHLGLDDQRDLLRRCAGTPLILDTHHSLRREITVDGYDGRMFAEPGQTEEERARVPTASWGNPESFWPTRPSLVKLLNDAGYGTVLALEPPTIRNRTFYLCV